MPAFNRFGRQYRSDLADEAAARKFAQETADKTGRRIVITDENGKEICTVKPAPRRNEVTLFRPKTC